MPDSPHRRAAHDWKCGAAKDLALDDKPGWDGPAAAERMLDAAGFNGDTHDLGKARLGFLFYDAGNPDLKGSYKEPFADIVDGKLTAMKAGVNAANQRLSATDVPEAEKTAAKAVIDHYDAAGKETRSMRTPFARDLYTVSWLAQIVQSLVCMQQESAWEEEYEGDDSPIPALLADECHHLAEILLAMNAEEVAELLAKLPDRADPKAHAMGVVARMMARRSFTRAAPGANPGLSPWLPRLRAGKVLSAANADKLSAAHDHCDQAMRCMREVLEGAGVETPETEPDDSDRAARAARIAEARALALPK